MTWIIASRFMPNVCYQRISPTIYPTRNQSEHHKVSRMFLKLFPPSVLAEAGPEGDMVSCGRSFSSEIESIEGGARNFKLGFVQAKP
jgi:hypothetical protein